jgi:hypothetical protein
MVPAGSVLGQNARMHSIALLVRAYREAIAARYLWHEFGDLCLIL